MIIGIDASRANKPNKTGTEWYSWHIIQELKKIANPDDQFLLYANSALTGDLGKMPANFNEKDLKWPPKYLWTQIRLWWELWRNPPDVLLVPAHTIPFLSLPKKIKVCVNVHDVGFRRSPELYKPIQVWYHDLTMRRIRQRADVIITISEFSKQEIIDLYQVPAEKIRVVYLGFDADKFSVETDQGQAEQILKKYSLTKPYLLYVGRLEKKKNIGNMIAALALVKEHIHGQNEKRKAPGEPNEAIIGSKISNIMNKQSDQSNQAGRQKDISFDGLQLVLAGGQGNQFEEIKKIISDNKLEKEVIITGYVAAEDLPVLYNQAEIFMFPTLYEGFGLPILEAMASGTPVITSNSAPHTEVGGDAALYADPRSPISLADKVVSLLDRRELRQSLVQKGLERAKEFSWRQTAEKIDQIIKK